jgi:hypothetical protein
MNVCTTTGPGYKMVDGTGYAPVVVFEQMDAGYCGVDQIVNASSRTLVVRDAAGWGNHTGTGDIYYEDVDGGLSTFNGQRVWARQFNTEPLGLHIQNNGGTLWILGLKTERGGTIIDTEGGSTELLGYFSYTTQGGALGPMFINNNGKLSVSGMAEAWFNPSDSPFTTLVQETRAASTLSLLRGQAPLNGNGGSTLPLYTGY